VLHPRTQRVEHQQHARPKEDREAARLGEGYTLHKGVHDPDEQQVCPNHESREDAIGQGAADHRTQVKQVVAQDGIGNGEGEKEGEHPEASQRQVDIV
jgi:hypothetical protein